MTIYSHGEQVTPGEKILIRLFMVESRKGAEKSGIRRMACRD